MFIKFIKLISFMLRMRVWKVIKGGILVSMLLGLMGIFVEVGGL